MLYLPKPNSCHLQWHITEKCNFKCTHCYLNEEYIKQELSTEECYRVVDQFVDYCIKTDIKQHRNLTLTGGEPILKKDWWKILEYISNYKKKGLIDRFYIMTNGSTVNDEIMKRYKDLGVNYMQVSVEGMEEINDQIRGKGNFKKAIEGSKSILRNGIPLSFSLTLTKKNILEVEPLARYAASLGIGGMGVGRITPIGMGEQMKKLMLTPQETKEWFEECERINQRLKDDGIQFSVDYHCSDGMYKQIRPGSTDGATTHGCSAPFDVFTLLPNGDVVPCRRLPIVVGNIREKSFLEIHYTSNELWNLKNWENKSDICKKCDSATLCRGGGKCIAYGWFGTPYAPDPDCWQAFGKDLSHEKFEKNPNSDKITYFKRYINNLRFDLPLIPDSEKKKKIRPIKLDKIDKVKDSEVDVLVFELEERDLNPDSGKKIKKYLEGLDKKGIKYRLGHALPPCIFDMETTKQFNHQTHNVPASCSECPSMFHIKDKKIIFCNEREGPDYKFMNNVDQIREFFYLMKDYDKPKEFDKCKTCVHKMRGTCFYLKNCRLEPKGKSGLEKVKVTSCGC